MVHIIFVNQLLDLDIGIALFRKHVLPQARPRDSQGGLQLASLLRYIRYEGPLAYGLPISWLILPPLAFAILGFARSLDESLIGTSASQPSFQRRFGLDDPSLNDAQKADLLGNIVAMVQVGSISGALMGFYITDRIGRLWAVRDMCILWVIGFAIFLSAGANGSLGMVYAGRFIAGMGIGQSVLVGPIYL